MEGGDPTVPGDQEDDAAPCVWFFIPLPQSLGLPHGWSYGELLPRRELLASTGAMSPLKCSLMVHQVPRTADVLLSDQVDVFDAAFTAIAQTSQARDATDLAHQARERAGGEFDSVITVIEAAVPSGAAQLDLNFLNAALDTAID